jgi:hypothetical protein
MGSRLLARTRCFAGVSLRVAWLCAALSGMTQACQLVPDPTSRDAGPTGHDAGPWLEPEDASVRDAEVPDAKAPDAQTNHDLPRCVPESDQTLCRNSGVSCGPLSTTDRCGFSRSVSECGACAAGEACNGGSCVAGPSCTPELDSTLCSSRGALCGTIEATDSCGTRSVSCGVCGAGQACNDSHQCEVRTCETDEEFCERKRASCGAVSALDDCGSVRTVQCGVCDPTQQCASNHSCVAAPALRKTWDDCNGDPSDGAETPLLFNAEHCGACNRSVDTFANGFGWCEDGTPRLLDCNLGYKLNNERTACVCERTLGGADLPDNGIDENCDGNDAQHSETRGFYVDPENGNDTSGNGSPDNPFRSFAGVMESGWTQHAERREIYVARGTLTDSLVTDRPTLVIGGYTHESGNWSRRPADATRMEVSGTGFTFTRTERASVGNFYVSGFDIVLSSGTVRRSFSYSGNTHLYIDRVTMSAPQLTDACTHIYQNYQGYPASYMIRGGLYLYNSILSDCVAVSHDDGNFRVNGAVLQVKNTVASFPQYSQESKVRADSIAIDASTFGANFTMGGEYYEQREPTVSITRSSFDAAQVSGVHLRSHRSSLARVTCSYYATSTTAIYDSAVEMVQPISGDCRELRIFGGTSALNAGPSSLPFRVYNAVVRNHVAQQGWYTSVGAIRDSLIDVRHQVIAENIDRSRIHGPATVSLFSAEPSGITNSVIFGLGVDPLLRLNRLDQNTNNTRYFANNTVVNIDTTVDLSACRLLSVEDAQRVELYGNVFACAPNAAQRIGVIEQSATSDVAGLRANAFANLNVLMVDEGGTNLTTLGAVNNLGDIDSDKRGSNVVHDSVDALRFADWSRADFRPMTDSPLLDVSLDTSDSTWGGVRKDLLGQDRACGSAYDRGAYELCP